MAVLEKIQEAVIGAQLKVASEVGFARRQNHPLSKLLKTLTAESQDAIDELARLMKNSESDKIRKECADILLSHLESVAKAIEQDSMLRMVATARYGGPKQLGYEEEDDTPQIDFSTVIDP